MKIVKTNENVILPEYKTSESAGMDIRAFFEDKMLHEIMHFGALEFKEKNGKKIMIIHPQTRVLIPTGLKIELKKGFEGQIRPRSGFGYDTGLDVKLGTIDSDYRGEIKISAINPTYSPIVIENNTRIAQLVISKVERVSIEEVTELSETERGSGGFGHTGTN